MRKEILLSELQFKATRSSGPGGQHVNKTSTRVELFWPLEDSQGLSTTEKNRLRRVLGKRLNKEGVLVLHTEATRSQHRNKELVIKKFFQFLEKGIRPPKKRKRTQPPRSANRKRLENKKKHAQKKALRRSPEF